MFQLSPLVAPLILVGCATMALTVYGIYYHQKGYRQQYLRAFICYVGVLSILLVLTVAAEITTPLEWRLTILNLGNAVVIPLLLYTFLWFTLSYTNRRVLFTRLLGFGALMHVLIIGSVVWANPTWMYTGYMTTVEPTSVFGVTVGSYVTIERTLKTPFYAWQLYSYALYSVGCVVLLQFLYVQRDSLVVSQILMIGFAFTLPVIVNVLVFLHIVSPQSNPMQFAFGGSAILFGISIIRYRLFEVAPIGRKIAVEQMNTAVVVTTITGRVIDHNVAFSSRIEAENDTFVGSQLSAALPEAATLLDTTGAMKVEQTIESTAQPWHAIVTKSPIKLQATQPAGFVITIEEITAQKEKEQTLEQQNEQLDRFASVVSHDLRGPLQTAKGYLSLAQDEHRSEELEEVRKAHDRMETMIEEFLALSRAKTAVVDPDPIELEPFITRVWGERNPTDATLTVEIPPGYEISGDAVLLTRLFENLFQNAVEHNTGHMTVTVGVPEFEDGTQGGFYVADNGTGIPPKKQDEIFEYGYSDRDGGTGLGLAIVESLVDAHGWDISVRNRSDHGAVFEVIPSHVEGRAKMTR